MTSSPTPPHAPLRVAFMGTPDFSVPTLEQIIAAGHTVVCVYTQPPRRAGRGKKLQASAVQKFAEERNIEVRHPKSLKGEAEQAEFAALDLDVAVVVAYGLILPQAILDAPRLGCLNVHASLLPRWRGAAPIHRAIMAGDTETGVMVMQMEAGLDTGPVLLSYKTSIDSRETTAGLHDHLAREGAILLGQALRDLPDGKLKATQQTEDGMTYATKVEKSESRINWNRPAIEVDQMIRGLTSWPGAFFELPGEKPLRVKILAATPAQGSGEAGTVIGPGLTIACTDGAISVSQVQPAGKSGMSAEDFMNGREVPTGTKLL